MKTEEIPVLQPFRRRLVARAVARLTLAEALYALDHDAISSGDFVHPHTRMAAYEPTRCAALTDGKRLLLTVGIAHTLGPAERNDRLKVLFDVYADGLGFVNFDFPVTGEPLGILHHLPYPEARSTRFNLPRPKKVVWHQRWLTDCHDPPPAERVLLAYFNCKDLFRAGPMCGFNIGRTRARTGEESSWNLASGNRFFDAAGFGVLHLDPPSRSVDLRLRDSGTQIWIEAEVRYAGSKIKRPQPLRLELADPLDQRYLLRSSRANAWKLNRADLSTPGRYRIYVISEQGIAADAWWFDWNPASPSKQPSRFVTGMYVDIPDDLMRSIPYTRESLRAQIKQLNGWGIRRLNWIDYAPPKKAALFWRTMANYECALASYRNCGDLLQRAATICRSLGMECIGTFKPFEGGYLDYTGRTPAKYDTVANNGSVYALQPINSANQHAAIRPHPDWLKPAALPVRSMTLVSDAPLPKLKPSDFKILVSDDNRNYQLYRGPMHLRVVKESRPHMHWSPAGPVPESGQRTCWVLYLDDLNIRHRFAALEWTRSDLHIVGRAFALVQAVDHDGRAVNLTLARTGNATKGFNIYTPRRAWNNHSEPITDWLDLGPGQWGIMLAPVDRLPLILEPTDPRTQKGWLGGVQSLIDRGVTGVDLRFLCHHVDCQDWGALAFSEAVRAAFRDEFGRQPEPTEEDLARVRVLRGRGVTDFVRAARKLSRAHGVKLIVHLEAGMEVPPHLHTRNQLHMDWRTWLDEKLVDEVMLKFFSSQHPFVQEQVLPLARRKRIAVHVCELNESLAHPWGIERASRLAQEARAAGLAGLSLYEAASYQRMNAESQFVPVGHAQWAVAAAAIGLS